MSFRFTSKLPRVKPEIFHGRDQVVDHAVQLLLAPKPARIPILGPGGIGKTSVALAIIYDQQIIARFADNRFFFQCDSTTNTSSLIAGLLQILQLDIQNNDSTQTLLDYLNSKPCILVLDNFETL